MPAAPDLDPGAAGICMLAGKVFFKHAQWETAERAGDFAYITSVRTLIKKITSTSRITGLTSFAPPRSKKRVPI